MYCSGLGALYGGGGVWPLLLPRSPPRPRRLDTRHTPPREGKSTTAIIHRWYTELVDSFAGEVDQLINRLSTGVSRVAEAETPIGWLSISQLFENQQNLSHQ